MNKKLKELAQHFGITALEEVNSLSQKSYWIGFSEKLGKVFIQFRKKGKKVTDKGLFLKFPDLDATIINGFVSKSIAAKAIIRRLNLSNTKRHISMRGNEHWTGNHATLGKTAIIEKCSCGGSEPLLTCAHRFLRDFPDFDAVIVEGEIFERRMIKDSALSHRDIRKILIEDFLINNPEIRNQGFTKRESEQFFDRYANKNGYFLAAS